MLFEHLSITHIANALVAVVSNRKQCRPSPSWWWQRFEDTEMAFQLLTHWLALYVALDANHHRRWRQQKSSRLSHSVNANRNKQPVAFPLGRRLLATNCSRRGFRAGKDDSNTATVERTTWMLSYALLPSLKDADELAADLLEIIFSL